jgi:hypothetical protein
MAEGYEPATFDLLLTRPGAIDEVRRVELKPLQP